MKYHILFDYHSEGMKFYEEVFDSVSEAVDKAVKLNYCSPFLIVSIINWEAIQKNENQDS